MQSFAEILADAAKKLDEIEASKSPRPDSQSVEGRMKNYSPESVPLALRDSNGREVVLDARD